MLFLPAQGKQKNPSFLTTKSTKNEQFTGDSWSESIDKSIDVILTL